MRVFKKWKGCAALTAVFLIIFAVIGFDLTGYETRVPNPANVEWVEVSGLSGYPWDSGANLTATFTEPETIEAAVALHRAVVENGEEGELWEDVYHLSYRVTYHLKSGKIVSRRYNVRVGEMLLELAQNIRDMDGARRQAYDLDDLEKFLANGGTMEWVAFHPGQQEEQRFYKEEAEALWNAVMADFAAGTIGVHSVDENDAEMMKEYDLLLIGDRLYAEIQLEFCWRLYQTNDEGTRSFYVQIAVREDSANTLAALERLMPGEVDEKSSLEDLLAGN